MDSWGGKGEATVAASRHPSWDEEDDGGGGVWNSTSSQGSSSSFNSGGWGQSHGGKRGNIKVGKSPHGVSWLIILRGNEGKEVFCLMNFISTD